MEMGEEVGEVREREGSSGGSGEGRIIGKGGGGGKEGGGKE